MKKKQPLKFYYADTETTQYHPIKGVRVYLWACIDDTDTNDKVGYDVESLYNYLKNLDGVVYFHNLKFDWSYLEYYLLKHEIKYTISERKGTIYKVKFGKVQLRDSSNLIQCSLAEIGENYARKYKKTSIDYEIATWEHQATADEVEYCLNDCRVLRDGLTNWRNNLREIVTRNKATQTASVIDKKLTYAGIAFEAFKELSLYEKCCPKTTQNEYNALIGSYHGGYVYSKPNGVVENVTMIDCNSMYPFIYSEKALPFGKGRYCNVYETIIEKDFYIINVDVKFDLKSGYIPIIGYGFGRYGSIDYKSSSDGEFINLTVCKYDWEIIQRYYDIEFIYNYGYWWATKNNFYKHYCDIFMTEKMNAKNKVIRTLAKMMLNSPYGKTAMNGLAELRRYYINGDDVAVSEISGYKLDESQYQYLPQAISITAQARCHLLNTAEMIGFDKVQYMDTDSIKFINHDVDMSKIWIDDKKLGAWKVEGRPTYFKTIAPKKYIIYEHGKLEITCAGFNKKELVRQMYHDQEVSSDKARLLINQFDKGLKLECLQSQKVKGGRALLRVLKEIK